MQNIANVWFQKSRVTPRSRHVQVSVSSRVFAQSLGLATSMSRLGLATSMSRLGLKDFGRDSSSGKYHHESDDVQSYLKIYNRQTAVQITVRK